MKSLKTIRLVYIVYTLYTFFVMLVSDYSILTAFLGLLAVWSVYLAYSLGFRSVPYDKALENINYSNNKNDDDKFIFSNINEWKSWQYVFAGVLCWLCSLLAARFYTSRTFLSVIRGLLIGENGYSIYQHYVIEANIGVLSIQKIPYILMLVFCTVLLFWSVLGIGLSGTKKRPIQWVFLALVLSSYYYFGLARGTNFELYIIFILIMYSLLNRGGNTKQDRRKRRRAIVVITIVAVLFILLFRFIVALRGNEFNYQICPELHYDPEKWFSQLFPTITNMGLSIFRYFGYGIFTIGTVISEVCMESIRGIIAFLIPFGTDLLFHENLMTITRHTVDIGVGWVADYFAIVNMLGIPLMLTVFVMLGRLNARLYTSNRAKLLKDLIGALIFIQMISIPVGNFITISTPNKLTAALVILWFCMKYKIKIKH